MELKDILYNKRNELGIKDDISYNDLLKLELIIKDYYKDNDILKNDIKILLDISIKMKYLLEECRKNKLPIKLGKEIDNILKDIENL